MAIDSPMTAPPSDLPHSVRTPALAGVLTNQAIVELYRLPGPVTTELKLSVAARVARTSGWNGYRGGRQRLASWVGTYVEWLVPDEKWSFELLEAAGQTWASWTDGDRWIADVLAPGELAELDMTGLGELARSLLAEADLDAVRVLTLSAPLASRVFTEVGPVRGVAVSESGLGFRAVA
ncbi:MAG: hypothetical protein ACXIVQ_15070 [Acidimicrobiales bacterium]